jgi:hypothetical protein
LGIELSLVPAPISALSFFAGPRSIGDRAQFAWLAKPSLRATVGRKLFLGRARPPAGTNKRHRLTTTVAFASSLFGNWGGYFFNYYRRLGNAGSS